MADKLPWSEEDISDLPPEMLEELEQNSAQMAQAAAALTQAPDAQVAVPDDVPAQQAKPEAPATAAKSEQVPAAGSDSAAAEEGAPGGEAAEDDDPELYELIPAFVSPGDWTRAIREVLDPSHPRSSAAWGFKRAFNTIVSDEVRKRSRAQVAPLQEENERLKQAVAVMNQAMGDAMFLNKSEEDLIKMRLRNPQIARRMDEWLENKRRGGRPQQQANTRPPAALVKAREKMEDMMEEASLELSEEGYATMQEVWRGIKWKDWADDPADLVLSWQARLSAIAEHDRRSIDASRAGVQNGRQQDNQSAKTSPDASAAGTAAQAVVRNNPAVQRMAPARGTRTNVSNGLPKIRKSQFDDWAMQNPDDYEKLLKDAGAEDSRDLEKAGIIIPG